MVVDYKTLNKNHKTKIIDRISDLKNGTWLPLSVAAFISGYSKQTLRMLYLQGEIKGLKFPVGSLLIKIESVPKKS
jgi:hypothetical protein